MALLLVMAVVVGKILAAVQVVTLFLILLELGLGQLPLLEEVVVVVLVKVLGQMVVLAVLAQQMVLLEVVRHKVTPVAAQATEMMAGQGLHLERMIRVVAVVVPGRLEQIQVLAVLVLAVQVEQTLLQEHL